MGADVHDTGDDDEKTPTAPPRRKIWIKVPPGHSIAEAPAPGGVEHHQVPVIESPICCEATPPLVDESDPEGDRKCPPCGSTWFP